MDAEHQVVSHFLQTGDYDPLFPAWPGAFSVRSKLGETVLREALVGTVERSAPKLLELPQIPSDLVAFTRGKVEPMVRGLFPRSEQEKVLGALERSVVYLTPANIRSVLTESARLDSAWVVASLYLDGVGGRALSPLAPGIVGMSEATTCYISPSYFRSTSPFADYLVHEAAHVFHNCKRGTIGLKQTKRREWLLDIKFSKRELFAYCCEAYSRLIVDSAGPATRRDRCATLREHPMPDEDVLDRVEYLDALREAVDARNGWQRIVERCSG